MRRRANKRLKVIPAFEPNAGLRTEYARKLAKVLAIWTKELRKQALLELSAPPEDRILGDVNFMAYVQSEAWAIKRAEGLDRDDVIVVDAMPLGLALDRWLSPAQRKAVMACARALIKFGFEAKKVSHWFCRKMLYRTSADMVRTLERAHVSKAIIRQKWQVPLIKGQFISKQTAQQLPEQIKWMTELITKLSAASTKKVQDELADALQNGHSYTKLRNRLMTLEHMDEARAERVARDQGCKLNQFIQQENARALGITQAKWIHVPGMYSSRPTHVKMHGQIFDLNKGMRDDSPEVGGAYVLPGQLPFCRCICQMVLTDELME